MKSKFIKTIAVSLVLLLSTTGVFAAVPNDVKGQSYETAVSALMDKGIITGDTNGNFNPEATLTRAQACVIIVKSMNPPSAEVAGTATQQAAKSSFTDMTGYGWAEGYVAYAVKHGVTKGYPDGTFKPGNTVSMNELVTMILRAAAYSDETLGGTWPSNYMTKATELKLLSGAPETLPVNATKWIAAQVDYNALALIEKANPQQQTPSESQTTPTGVPDTSAMTYASGSFNMAITTFNGNTLADGVKVYTYGQKSAYSSTMTFSKKADDYRLDTIYKYKNVETPAFYQLKDGKIVTMVLPKDVGWSGYAYGVINGTYATTNEKGESVTGLKTFVAGQEIKWVCDKGLTGIPDKTGGSSYLNGTVYELKLSNGKVKSIRTTADTSRPEFFKELSGTAYADVSDYSGGVVKLDTGELIDIRDSAVVYVMDNADRTKYKIGKQSSIKEGNEVRVFDMSDNDEISGDIVVVLDKQ